MLLLHNEVVWTAVRMQGTLCSLLLHSVGGIYIETQMCQRGGHLYEILGVGAMSTLLCSYATRL